MKQLLFCLLIFGATCSAQAQDRWLYWKYKDYDKGINFSVPRAVFATGSLFLKNKEERRLLRRVHKTRMLIFEDGTPVSERDIRRFNRKAKRRHLEEIITVRSEGVRVQIMAKERRNALRKVVVFINSPEDGFFMISIKGKLKIKDINEVIKKSGKGKIPEIPKMPKIKTDLAGI
jgi:hypothetical protein